MRRPALLATALTLAIAGFIVPGADVRAQDARLPDIGSSAGELITPTEQAQYGAMMLSQLRHYDYTLDDPLLNHWLKSIGSRLAASSDDPRQPFTFFMLRDRRINAFATLGGYIGVNAGLVLSSQSEGEVAGVMAHEIAHVTQMHVLRGAERAQRDSVPIMLAMLGAIALASASGSSSSGEATQAAIVSAMGLMQQRQIDYTRSNESEADRVGIRTLSRSGYDPEAMADFFQRMLALSRGNSGGYSAPDYLRSHPVTTTRISEAKQRAAQLSSVTPRFTPTSSISDNPLLPGGLTLPADLLDNTAASGHYKLARERLRALSADTPAEAIREYERIQRVTGELDDAQRYGLAVAHLQAGQGAQAVVELTPLLQRNPGDTWLILAMAEAEARSGKLESADRRFESLLARMPHNAPVAMTYARMLGMRNTVEAGRRAQAVLRPLQATSSTDPVFQRVYARASEIAGEPIRAGEAWAEVALLTGRAEQALLQLQTLKQRPEVDYYARARIDARIAAITPIVLELQRQGIKDEVLNR